MGIFSNVIETKKMAPTDNSPCHSSDNFELISSLEAYNKIPVHEFKSKRTGLTLVIAQVEGPVVNGYFCLGIYNITYKFF